MGTAKVGPLWYAEYKSAYRKQGGNTEADKPIGKERRLRLLPSPTEATFIADSGLFAFACLIKVTSQIVFIVI